MKLKHKSYKCKVVFGQYGNGNVAIQLMGAENTDYEAELITTASVNGQMELMNDVVGIKTWSENEGIVQSLIDGNIIEPELVGLERTGFVAIEHYRLTDESMKEINKLKEEVE